MKISIVIRLFSVFFLLLTGCAPPQPDARQIVDAAIAAHGGERYLNVSIEFDFRGRKYTAERNGGIFRYSRTFGDSTGTVVDVLDNHGFTRTVNGEKVELSEADAGRYSRSVNSVIYFALLPFPLQDPAVQLQKLADTEIAGQPYHTIEVTFRQEGGGRDHDDVFLYWFHRERNTMDYLAYEFQVDGGGIRFREAFNARVVGGIRFADYRNYKPGDSQLSLRDIAAAFQRGELTKVSDVVLENITVQ